MPETLMHRGLGLKDCQNAGDLWRRLLQFLKPLATHCSIVTGETGDIAAGMGETLNKSGAHRIADPDEHDRHLLRHRLQHRERGVAEHQYDIGREREDLPYSRAILFRLARPPADVGTNVAIL